MIQDPDPDDVEYTDDDEPGIVKSKNRPAKKAKITTEPEWPYCTRCCKRKQSDAFDPGRKRCRACLHAQRMWVRRSKARAKLFLAPKKRQWLNNIQQASKVCVFHLNLSQGNRSGLRQESTVVTPGPSDEGKGPGLDPNGRLACEDSHERHTMGTHIGSPDALSDPGKTGRRISFIISIQHMNGNGSTQRESTQDINDKATIRYHSKTARNERRR